MQVAARHGVRLQNLNYEITATFEAKTLASNGKLAPEGVVKALLELETAWEPHGVLEAARALASFSAAC